MNDINTIFTIIDPSTDKQYALQRAMRIASVVDARIHAYLCLSPSLESHDPEALKRVEIARYEPWVEEVVSSAREEGFDVTTQVEWNPDWREAMGTAALAASADLIVKASHRRTATKRLMMTSSDLALLETANCSVQLVSSAVIDDLHKVLIAVDAKNDDKEYQRIFDAVVAWGKTVASTNENGELHAVYAYTGSDDFRHLTDIAKHVGIDTAHVHELEGKPEEAIVEVAKEIDAQIIIIGLSTKGTLVNRIFGNMVDRLLNNIDHDILVVIPEETS